MTSGWTQRIAPGEDGYPRRLSDVRGVQPTLHVAGTLRESSPTVAIVGSRAAASDAMAMAGRLARHVAAHRQWFIEAAGIYWQRYVDAVGDLSRWDGYEPRAVRHTLACLLARVDGRSPLEYLTADERSRQRALVLALMAQPPTTIPQLIQTFAEGL